MGTHIWMPLFNGSQKHPPCIQIVVVMEENPDLDGSNHHKRRPPLNRRVGSRNQRIHQCLLANMQNKSKPIKELLSLSPYLIIFCLFEQ